VVCTYRVVGSSPVVSTFLAQMVERRTSNSNVVGSSLTEVVPLRKTNSVLTLIVRVAEWLKVAVLKIVVQFFVPRVRISPLSINNSGRL
jgi:hypothetical protein